MSKRRPSSPLSAYAPDDPPWPADPDPAWEAIYPMADRQYRRDEFYFRRDHDPQVRLALAGLRELLNAFRAARECTLPGCRRAGRCVAPKVDCAFRYLPVLQKHVFPLLRRRYDPESGGGEAPSGEPSDDAAGPAASQKSRRT